MNQGGFEPPTSRLSSVRSNQLSYGFRTNAKMQMKSGGPRPPRRKLVLGIPRNNLRCDWGGGEMCKGVWLCRLAARSVAGCGAVGHQLYKALCFAPPTMRGLWSHLCFGTPTWPFRPHFSKCAKAPSGGTSPRSPFLGGPQNKLLPPCCARGQKLAGSRETSPPRGVVIFDKNHSPFEWAHSTGEQASTPETGANIAPFI